MTTTRLLIARHGNTFAPGDVVRRVGTTDLPLVESGLAQGRRLGIYLKEQGLIPDLLYSSELRRARQTVEEIQTVLQRAIPTEVLSTFNEIDYGPDENQAEEKVLGRIGSEALKAWEVQAKVPEGWKVDPQQIILNWQDFAAKLREKQTGKTVLVVTSNGILRFAPYLTRDFSQFAAQYGIKMATGALSVFEHRANSETWDCVFWNRKSV